MSDNMQYALKRNESRLFFKVLRVSDWVYELISSGAGHPKVCVEPSCSVQISYVGSVDMICLPCENSLSRSCGIVLADLLVAQDVENEINKILKELVEEVTIYEI